MNIIILMAGVSADFEEKGHSYPKYLLEIHNKPMIQRIVESLEHVGDKITCIIRKEDQDKYFMGDTLKILCPKCKVIEVAGNTKGAVCTALFAIEAINNDEELLILNGDQLIKTDIIPAIKSFKERSLDAGVITFKGVHPKYSSIMLDENGFIIQTSEKRPISDISSTGCCYYKHGSDFIQGCFSVIEKDVNTQGLYYISSTLNELILNQKKVGIYEISKKDYVSFSNYQMYETYISNKRG